MRRRTRAGLTMLFLIAILTTTPHAQAQDRRFDDAAIRQAVSRHARSSATVPIRRVRQRKPCNLKRRVLAGAVIGAATGMVAVNMAAASFEVSASGTDTLGAGAIGATLGAVIGLRTCR